MAGVDCVLVPNDSFRNGGCGATAVGTHGSKVYFGVGPDIPSALEQCGNQGPNCGRPIQLCTQD